MDIGTLMVTISSESWLFQFLLVQFKASLILLIALFIHRQLNLSSAARRNFLCNLMFASLLVLPLLSFSLPQLNLPQLNLPVLPLVQEEGPDGSLSAFFDSAKAVNFAPDNAALATSPTVLTWLALAYCCIMLLLMIRFLLGIYRVIKLSRQGLAVNSNSALTRQLAQLSKQFSIRRKVRLVISTQITTPITYGVLRPVIIWPEVALTWPTSALQCALSHELAHIKRLDWVSLLVARLACILFWMLPMSWMFARQLAYDAERASDDLVLSCGNRASTYAEQLLQLSQNQTCNVSVMAVSMLHPTAIFDRIHAILDARQNRDPMERTYAIAYLLPALCCLLAIAAINATVMASTSQALGNYWPQHWHRINSYVKQVEKPQLTVQQVFDIKGVKQSALKVAAMPTSFSGEAMIETLTVSAYPDRKSYRSMTAGVAVIDHHLPIIHIEGYLPLHTVTPKYPVMARNKGIEGYVVVRFDIDDEGLPQNIEIIDAAPQRIFDRSVIQAISQSRYVPQAINGQRVKIKGVSSRIRFKLQPSRKAKLRALARNTKRSFTLFDTS